VVVLLAGVESGEAVSFVPLGGVEQPRPHLGTVPKAVEVRVVEVTARWSEEG
jgi:hypothetical protein